MSAATSDPLPLPDWRAIRVTGNDRETFLQGQLTQDISAVTPERSMPAGWASAKGRLLCTLWICNWDGDLYLILPGSLADEVARRLQMFVLRADVSLEISPLPVSLITDIEPDEGNTSNCFYDESICRFRIAGNWGLQLGPAGAGGDDSGGSTALRQLCIAAGVPVVTEATREAFVPQMVNLDLLGGISFTKGCYVGQEVVARTQNLGRIKRRMYRFRADPGSSPAPGEVIKCDDHGAGKIVDAAATRDGSAIELLAVIRIESLRDQLSLEDGRALQQLPLPYNVPESVD